MESIKDLLGDPLKGTSKAQNILSYLFREVLLWRKINLRVWRKKTDAFFDKPYNADYQDRGNLNKALKANIMQWQSFKRAMDFLDPVKCTLEVKLTLEHKVCSYLIVLDPKEDEANPSVNHFPWEHCKLFKGAKPAETLLAHLIRHILSIEAEGIKDVKDWFDDKILSFVKEPKNSLGYSDAEVSTFYNTLRRDILDNRISWNKFRRGINLLNPLKEEYVLTLEWTKDEQLKRNLPDSVHRILITDPHLNNI